MRPEADCNVILQSAVNLVEKLSLYAHLHAKLYIAIYFKYGRSDAGLYILLQSDIILITCISIILLTYNEEDNNFGFN